MRKITSAQILPTVEMVSTGYSPRKVSAPRRIASLPEATEKPQYNTSISLGFMKHIILSNLLTKLEEWGYQDSYKQENNTLTHVRS